MEGSQTPTAEDRLCWSRLTDKQRACLDRLLERKTSKQIARELGVSKYTVDQRLTAARLTLGASDRGDAANRYARLRRLCDRVAYDPVQVPGILQPVQPSSSDGGSEPVLDLGDAAQRADRINLAELSFEKIWRHDHRLPMRLAITAATLVTLIVFLLGSLGIAESLTRLVSG